MSLTPMPRAQTPIDLIGDIPGHADELEALLQKLGYAKKDGTYGTPDRTVLFAGDFINQEPHALTGNALVAIVFERRLP
jgi:hypothetical protein